MNAQKKENRDCNSNFEKRLSSLNGLGYFDDDIQAQLEETVRSISQDIIDILSARYQDARRMGGDSGALPKAFWSPLRKKAYLMTAAHCDKIAAELRRASNDAKIRF